MKYTADIRSAYNTVYILSAIPLYKAFSIRDMGIDTEPQNIRSRLTTLGMEPISPTIRGKGVMVPMKFFANATIEGRIQKRLAAARKCIKEYEWKKGKPKERSMIDDLWLLVLNQKKDQIHVQNERRLSYVN